jgi:hypothetical protein
MFVYGMCINLKFNILDVNILIMNKPYKGKKLQCKGNKLGQFGQNVWRRLQKQHVVFQGDRDKVKN